MRSLGSPPIQQAHRRVPRDPPQSYRPSNGSVRGTRLWKSLYERRSRFRLPLARCQKTRASGIGHQRSCTLPVMYFFGTTPHSRLSELLLR